MKKILYTILLIGLIMSPTGCENFSHPYGVWTCEELSLTVDFSTGRGTIVIDDVVGDVTVNVLAGDIVIYCFLEGDERATLSGDLLHKGGGCAGRWDAGKGVMYFNLQKRSANVPFDIDTYTFVKVEQEAFQ